MMRWFAALVAVLFVAGTAAAAPMGTGTLRVEAQGTPQDFMACFLVTLADQTYNVFGHDVNLGTDVGAFTVGSSDQNLDTVTSYPDGSVFSFQSTHAVVCVDPPDCTTESFVTSSVSNVSGSLPAILGSDVSYSFDGLIDNAYTLGSTTIPGCTLTGTVAVFLGTVNFNAFQTQSTSVGSNQTVGFPATTFVNPLDNQPVSVDVGVTFSQVTGAGTTTVTATSNAAGEIPANFAGAVNGYKAAFLDVSTTAAVQPPIVVCSTYTDADDDDFIDGTTPPISESALSLLHGEGDPKVFVDRTVSRDPITNVICAQVDSLSPFVLAVDLSAVPTSTPTPTPTDTPTPTPGSTCPPVPLGGCTTAGKSLLLIKDKSPAGASANDKVIWKWLKGTVPTQSAFGDPMASAQYKFCIYTGVAQNLTLKAEVPPVVNWQTLGDKGYELKDTTATAAGVEKILLKSGSSGKGKALVKGRGDQLDLTPNTLPLPGGGDVIVQLGNSDNSNCWQAAFTNAVVNKDTEYKAKTP